MVIALVDTLEFPEADAVIRRLVLGPPHDFILMKADRASPVLFLQSIETLKAVFAMESACPPEDKVIRVRTQGAGSVPPGAFGATVRERATRTMERLREEEDVRRVPLVAEGRMTLIWARRYFGPEEPIPPPEVLATGVCYAKEPAP